jgi:RNA polymerase sigma factor (sigma-70 family)
MTDDKIRDICERNFYRFRGMVPDIYHEDALSEIETEVRLRGVAKFDGRGDIEAYAGLIASYAARDAARRYAVRTRSGVLRIDHPFTARSTDAVIPGTENLRYGEKLIADDPLPDEDLSREIVARLVRQFVDKLPAKEREVVTSYYLDGKRLADVATERGVTGARISQILKAARKRLRTMIDGTLVPEDCTG